MKLSSAIPTPTPQQSTWLSSDEIIIEHFKEIGRDFHRTCCAIGHSEELELAKDAMKRALTLAVSHVMKGEPHGNDTNNDNDGTAA